MKFTLWLCIGLIILATGCGRDSPALGDPVGTYVLIEENGNPPPTNPTAPYGCCLTLSATLTFDADTYELHGFYRNISNSLEFDNIEYGTFTRDDDTLYFTLTGLGGYGAPYLLAPGRISDGGRTITLLYGDEGPGSNQIESVFRRSSSNASGRLPAAGEAE